MQIYRDLELIATAKKALLTYVKGISNRLYNVVLNINGVD